MSLVTKLYFVALVFHPHLFFFMKSFIQSRLDDVILYNQFSLRS